MHAIRNAPARYAADPLRAAAARHVVGMTVTVETLLDADALRASLPDLADASAFRLDRFEPATTERGESETADTGHRGDFYAARFILRAPGGVAGDRQIFQLLEAVAAEHRWDEIEKILRFDA